MTDQDEHEIEQYPDHDRHSFGGGNSHAGTSPGVGVQTSTTRTKA